jgi:hypothetical protein
MALDPDGVEVEVHDVEALLHGYSNTVGADRAADRDLERHVRWLRHRLGEALGEARSRPDRRRGTRPGNY